MADAKLEQKLERLLDRLEILLPKTEDEVDWSAAAFRWRLQTILGHVLRRPRADSSSRTRRSGFD